MATSTTEVIIYESPNLTKQDLISRYGQPKISYPIFDIYNLRNDQIAEIQHYGNVIQNLPNKYELDFCSGKTRRTVFNPPGLEQDTNKKVYLVQFYGPIKEEWKTALINRGVQVYGYMHPYTVYAYLDPMTAQKLNTEGLYIDGVNVIDWIGYYTGQAKKNAIMCAVRQDEDVVVHYFPWTTETQQQTPDLPNILALAAREDVIFVESRRKPHLLNAQSKIVTGTATAYQNGILGTNEIVAVTDTGIYKPHEVFSNTGKIVTVIDIAGDSGQLGGDGYGHGTHVAGTVAGDAPPYLTSNKYDGQAIRARLIDVKVFDNAGVWKATDEYSFWQQAYQAGARVNNNSWGSDTFGAYSISDRDADRIMADNRDYVIVVANGNAGPNISTVGAPAVAKNVISVGAVSTNSAQDVATFSSRGPTSDGRIKPDVMAPGAPVISAQTQTVDGYVAYQGTSMASPQVAGISALIREYFKKGLYEGVSINPSGALVKALLINGAQEIVGAGSDSLNEGKFPNNSQGWGLVSVPRTLPFTGGPRKIKVWDVATSPATGSLWSQTFTLDFASPEVKINLVWIDLAAVPGTSSALINNLSLRVVAPNGTTFLGNNFTGRNPGYSITGGAFDAKNSVEGVYLVENKSFPGLLPTGTYRIDVLGQGVTNTNLGFAVVVGIQNIIPRAAVMGDYNGQLKSLMEERGYLVDSYAYNDYASLIPRVSNYRVVVLNRVANTSEFDQLLVAAGTSVGLVFASSYPVEEHGLGVLSIRTNNPLSVDQKYGLGPVMARISGSHPITRGLGLNNIYTIINGGDNDYQTYSGFTGSQTVLSNAMPQGLPGMIGVQEATTSLSRRVILGTLGAEYYTNVSNWTAWGIEIFKRSVAWAGGLI